MLDGPIADARRAAAGVVPMNPHEVEVARQMQICNACRYCEGFCAVFPAMTRRLAFEKADVHYLANLCHNCGACLHACQYAPPHEFAVNVPQALAKVRLDTYVDYAWPAAFGALYRRNGLVVALALAGGLALFLALAVALHGPLVGEPANGRFYDVFPHNFLAALFGVVFVTACGALAVGVGRFWRGASPPPKEGTRGDALVEAAESALSLRYLGGGHGDGCNDADDRFSLWRRRFHHLAFYGFLACFASTCVATIDHYLLHAEAPYPWASAPVVLGVLGGLGLLVGPLGLFVLNVLRHPLHGDPSQRGMDRGFIVLLLLTSATGLALLAGRDGGAMPLLLAIHLGVVLALFATMPYGKFAHGFYRTAALVKFAIEKRQPNRLGLKED
jgi:citrate/tricarballylate utilization protein